MGLARTRGQGHDTWIPVATSGLLYADAPFPFVYLITGYGDYLVGGESQQEAARWDVVSWLEYTSLSNIVAATEDVFAPIEWGSMSLADNSVPTEASGPMLEDATVPGESNIGALQDVTIVVLGSEAMLRFDAPTPIEATGSVQGDVQQPLEWLRVVYAPRPLSLEYIRSGLRRDVTVAAKRLVAARSDKVVAIEWQSQITAILEDVSVPLEWTIKALSDVPAPSEWLAMSGPYTNRLDR
jgi:hypothetical protein